MFPSVGNLSFTIQTNQLPLRHVFNYFDGITDCRETFTDPIGKKVQRQLSGHNHAVYKYSKSVLSDHAVC